MRMRYLVVSCLCVLLFVPHAIAAPPKLTIIHFDVNTGDATLVISPDGHGVLIDAGNNGRGNDPILEYMNRSKENGRPITLDYSIVTHYDADHLGGMDEVLKKKHPQIAVYDRGDTNLRPFVRNKLGNCAGINLDELEGAVNWGTAPSKFCKSPSKGVTCKIAQYYTEAIAGGKRQSLKAGDEITLDHGLKLTVLISNATDIDGNSVNVYTPGRRGDCGENDLSIGLLLEYGDFRYLIAGDLTGDIGEKVADIEELIKDDAANVDVYHVNHHGAKTSSSKDFMDAIKPTVAIVSNGGQFGHPRKDVVNNRILSLDPKPRIFLTNKNEDDLAWSEDDNAIADIDRPGFDGIIEMGVWKRSYRIWRWRNGNRIDDPGIKFRIKRRE
jgi:beta-lactamase superfamily II metal-dependent hydrolase